MRISLLKSRIKPSVNVRDWVSKQSFKDNRFSLKQLISFGVAFGLVGGTILYFVLAVPTTKTWDTQADFDGTGTNLSTKDNVVSKSTGQFTLQPSTNGTCPAPSSSAAGTNIVVQPNCVDHTLPQYFFGVGIGTFNSQVVADPNYANLIKSLNPEIVRLHFGNNGRGGYPSNPGYNLSPMPNMLNIANLFESMPNPPKLFLQLTGWPYPAYLNTAGAPTDPNNIDKTDVFSTKNLADWATYFNQRWPGALKYFEAYNEPATDGQATLPNYWYGPNSGTYAAQAGNGRSAADWATAHNGLYYDAIKAADPNINFYGFVFSGIGSEVDSESQRFLDGIPGTAWPQLSNMTKIDAVSYHGYQSLAVALGAPSRDQQRDANAVFYPTFDATKSGFTAGSQKLRDNLNARGGQSKKIAQSEFGSFGVSGKTAFGALMDSAMAISASKNQATWNLDQFNYHAISPNYLDPTKTDGTDAVGGGADSIIMANQGTSNWIKGARYEALQNLIGPFLHNYKKQVNLTINNNPSTPGSSASNSVPSIQASAGLNSAGDKLGVLLINTDLTNAHSVNFNLNASVNSAITGRKLTMTDKTTWQGWLAAETSGTALPAVTALPSSIEAGSIYYLEIPINGFTPVGPTSPTTTYPSSGSIILPTFDATVPSHFSGFSAADTKPTGTNIVYEAQTSCDGTNWSGFVPVGSVPDGRYLQIKATLTSSNASVTPTVDSISIIHDVATTACQSSSSTIVRDTSNTVSAYTGFGVSSSQNYTVGANNNRILLAYVQREYRSGNNNVASVKYNNIPLTKLTGAGTTSTADSEIWYLLNPDTGTHPLVLDFGGGTSINYRWGASTYYNAKQVAPTNISNSGLMTTSVTSATNTLAGTVTNSLVVDLIAGSGGGLTTILSDLGQTQALSITDRPGAGGYGNITSSYKTGGGNIVTKETASAGTFSPWSYVQLELVPADASVVLPSPVNTAVPIVTGSTIVGQTLTTTDGTWSNSPINYTYQWQSCDSTGNTCANIAGATSATYILTPTEQGKTLKAVVTATNATGSTPSTSIATSVVAAAVLPTPTITQNITAGQILTGNVTWTATVTANASSISRIEFAIDSNSNNTTDTTAPYERLLDTKTLTDGIHSMGLTVTLTDGTVIYAPYQIGNITVDNADHTPPATPTNLVGTPIASPPTVNLTWTASTDNVAVVAYSIYRGVGGATPTLLNTTTTATTTYSDTSVTSATSYTYQVTAVDAAGNESAGSIAVVVDTPDITPPTTPTNLSIVTTSVPTILDLTWAASYDAVGVMGYEVYRGQGSAAPALLTTLTNVTSYSDTTVSANTSYAYYLKAIDAAGNASIQSTTFSIVTPKLPDTTAPVVAITTPAASAEVRGNAVRISATATDNESVANVQLYLNYDGNSANNKLGPLLTTGTNDAYSYTWDTTTLANTSYTLTAVATDTSNNTATSTTVTVVVNNPVVTPPTPPDTTAPSVPAGLAGSASSDTTVNLSWNASSDNAGGSGMSGYLIYRNGEAVPIAATDQLSYLDINLTASTDYTYTIAAIDNLGNQSAKGTQIKVTTPASAVIPTPAPVPVPVPVPVTPVTPPTTSQPTTSAPPSLSAKHSKGDANNNDRVDIIDLSIVLSHFNSKPEANTNGDVNGDGQVNVIDLSILLSNYGR